MKVKTANSKRLNILGNGDSSSNREILTEVLNLWRQKLGYLTIFTTLPAIFASLTVQEARAEESDKPGMRPAAGRTVNLLEKLNKRYSKPELMRRQSGFLAPMGDVDGLAAHLGVLARDPELRARLGRAGAADVLERFATSRMADELEAVYRRLLAR